MSSTTTTLTPAQSAEDRADTTCRICWDGPTRTDRLLSPCACRGSAQFIHTSCLQTWQRTNYRNWRYHKGSHCDLCQSRFTGPGVLHSPRDRLMRCCQACQSLYVKGANVPVIGQTLMMVATSMVITNAVACGLHLGLKGAAQGWLVGRFLASTVYTENWVFLSLCDALSFMHDQLPAQWRQREAELWSSMFWGAIVPVLLGGGLGLTCGALLGAAKGLLDTVKLGGAVCHGILHLSRCGLAPLRAGQIRSRMIRSGLQL